MSEVLRKKGQAGLCKNCNDLIFVLAKDLVRHEPLSTDLFEKDAGQFPWALDEGFNCRTCGALWFLSGDFRVNFREASV